MKRFPLLLTFLFLCGSAFGQYSGAITSVSALTDTPTITGLSTIDAIAIQSVDHGNLGADEDFSALLGYHLATLSAATCTVTLSDFPAAPYVGSITIDVFQDSTGGRTITWPGEVTYPPQIDPAPSAETNLLVKSFDGGATFVVRSSFDASNRYEFPTALSDDTYTGEVLYGYVNSGGVTQWQAVYLNSSSQWVKADANGSGTYPARGIAVSTQLTTVATPVLTEGVFRDDGQTWTPGGNIYLSTGAGGLTQTPPATSGDKVQVIGFALSAHVVRVKIGADYGEVP